MNITGGATDVSTYFVMRLSATGVEATGLTITNMDLQYVRTGAAPAAKVDATALAAADSAHSDNYAFEVDATDQPGLYRVDWPDAAFAAGAKQVILTVKCATCFTEHLAVDIDPPVNVTRISDDSTAADNAELMFDGTGYAGGTTKLDVNAASLASGAADTIHDEVVEGTYTHRQLMRLIAAALLGEVSGAGTTTITIRDAADAKTRISATVDAAGNRSAVALTET